MRYGAYFKKILLDRRYGEPLSYYSGFVEMTFYWVISLWYIVEKIQTYFPYHVLVQNFNYLLSNINHHSNIGRNNKRIDSNKLYYVEYYVILFYHQKLSSLFQWSEGIQVVASLVIIVIKIRWLVFNKHDILDFKDFAHLQKYYPGRVPQTA